MKQIASKTICLLIAGFIVSTSFAQTATITLKDTANAPIISRHIYGHFAEHLGRSIYNGIVRNGAIRTDIVDALKEIRVPNLRWPGGCFADEYHWRDGVGPKSNRPVTLNTTWGMVEEDNSFGTHEFLDLCERIGTEPYFAGNVGTGTPQEMAGWIEYLNSNSNSTLANERRNNGHPKPYNVTLWGVGNESWGCGGDMAPDYYANLYKQYASFCETYPGASPLKKIVSGANSDDYNWTEVCMKNIPTGLMWGLSLHYYTLITGHWPPSGSSTQFGEDEYFNALYQALRMDEIIRKHSAIMDKYDPKKKVALLVDEWGIWTKFKPSPNPSLMYQQNSLRDALLAASTLNIFHHHADRVKVANLAQAVNVIHSIILTDGDKMLLTPTYHVFNMMKVHQDAKYIPLEINAPSYSFNGKSISAVNASASIDSTGKTNITLVNFDPLKTITVSLNAKSKTISAEVLTSQKFDDHNTFDQKEKVKPVKFTGFKKEGDQLSVALPPMSVVSIQLTQ